MGTLKTFLDSNAITPKAIWTVSRRIESTSGEDKLLLDKRTAKRRGKDTAGKKYDELGIAKPSAMGRGLSEAQLAAAIEDKAVPRKVRTKIYRAVNHILKSAKKPEVEFKAMFEGSTAKVGEKPVAKTAKA
jgi:hypothetical protein